MSLPTFEPRVIRSPHTTSPIVMSGQVFADGRERVALPLSATDAEVAEVAAALEQRDAEAERLRAAIAAVNELLAPPCPYTFSHTRHWCGNEGCRNA
jgi:hypothetical protein